MKTSFVLALACVTSFSGPCSQAIAQTADCVFPSRGLVSWWTGDDTAADQVGSNHGLVRFGAHYADGMVGRGFSFTGVVDVVEVPAANLNVGSGDFTWDGWIKTTAAKDYSTIVGFEGNAAGLYVTGGNGGLRLWPAAGTTVGGFNDGQFHHFAVVRRSGVLTYYRDGGVIGTASFVNNLSHDKLRIGSDTLAADAWAGVIDELDFFDRALSTGEIQAIYEAGAAGKCKLGTVLPGPGTFFIEVEDFDYDGGQHKPAASVMPYFGGAYAGLSAVSGIDYFDPGVNEYAEYRPATQTVALGATGDWYRDGYEVTTNYRIGWADPGDWCNYTRVFPLPAREYYVDARLGSGALSNAVQLDRVTAGAGSTNQALSKIGEARGRPSGFWLDFLSVPFRDASGALAKVSLGGPVTLRLTTLPDSNQELNYLQFVPVTASLAVPCSAPSEGLVARWRGEGNSADVLNANPATAQNNVRFAPGKVGQAFQLDGNAYLSTSLDVQPGTMPTMTWEGWVFPMQPAGRQQIFSTDDGGFDRSFGVEGKYFSVFVGDGIWPPTTVSLNQWQHIAVIYSPTNVLFYKNGARYVLGRPAPGQATQNRLHLGRNPGFGEYFQGLLDEVSVYNRALTETEIKGLACRIDNGPACPAAVLNPLSLSSGSVSVAYSQLLTATGGTPPYTFYVTQGALPPGLTLSRGGLLSGTAAGAGTFNFTVESFDANGCASTRTYALTMNLCGDLPANLVSWWPAEGNMLDRAGNTTALANNGIAYAPGKVGQAFRFTGTNHVFGPLNLLTNIGSGDFTVDGWIQTDSRRDYNAIVSFNRYNPAIYMRADGRIQLWDANVSATGGFNDGAFHHFAVVRHTNLVTYYKDGQPIGTAGAGKSIEPQGFIYLGDSLYPGEGFVGLIDELDVFNRALSAAEIQRIYAQDAAGKCGAISNPGVPAIRVSPAALSFGSVALGQNQELSLTVSNGGTAGLTVSGFASDNGQFTAPGFASPLNVAAGTQTLMTFRFTPVAVGLMAANLTLQNNDPAQPALRVNATGTGTAPACQTLGLTPSNLAGATLGGSYAATVTAANGTAPYRFALNSGGLPPGLTLSTNGGLSGVPTAAGTFNFNVRATDAAGCTGLRDYSLIVSVAPGTGPYIQSLIPPLGPPGSQVAIRGANFGSSTAAVSVLFGNLPAALRSVSDNEIVVVAPPELPRGSVAVGVAVRGRAGNSAAFAVDLPATPPPSLKVTRDVNRDLLLSWPSSLTNFTLQFSEQLPPAANWNSVNRIPQTVGGELIVREPSAGTNRRFYRLAGSGGVPSGTQLILPDDWQPTFPVELTTSATVPAASGAMLRLNNGAVLQIPAGALPRDTQITFTKLDLTAYNAGVRRHVYRVDAGSVRLSTAAVLTLPYGPLAPGATTADVHVFRQSEGEVMQELPAQIDPVNSVVRVETDHFSDITVEDDRSYLSTWTDTLQGMDSKILTVPYYAQFDTKWCYAASSQMMAKYYGRDIEAWDVGHYFNVGLMDSPKMWQLWAGNYGSMFQSFGLRVRETCGWLIGARIFGYIIQQLNANRPVMVIVESNHAIVVVGYDNFGFWIHDPSGASVSSITGKAPNTSRLARIKFGWNELESAFFNNLSVIKAPFPAYTIVLEGAPAAASPVSASLKSMIVDSEGRLITGGFDIGRSSAPGQAPNEAIFQWDGRFPQGYWFAPQPGFYPSTLANSDDMYLAVQLHNAGNVPQPVSVEVSLANERIHRSSLTLDPASSSQKTDIFFTPPYHFKDGTPNQRFPGTHQLRVDLLSGGNVVDSIPVFLEIAPARPSGVKKEVAGSGVKVTWTANPEASFTSLEYQVYREGVYLGTTTAREYTHAGGKFADAYTIVALHPPTKLRSPISFPAEGIGALVYVREGEAVIQTTTPDPRGEERVTITESGVQVTFKNLSNSITWDAVPTELIANAVYPFRFYPSWSKHEVSGAQLGDAVAANAFIGAFWAGTTREPRAPLGSDPSRVNNAFWMSSGYYSASDCNCFRRDIEPWSWPTTLRGYDQPNQTFYLVIEIQTARQYSTIYWKYVEKKPAN